MRILALVVSVVIVSGCVQTTPLVSHAHIGHAMTSWHDTPNQEGLFEVADKELGQALESATFAVRAAPGQVRRYLEDTQHALNPDRQPVGPGLGYGAIRALTGAIEHLEYAAGSDDASQNFVGSVVDLVDQGDLVIGRLLEAERLIADAPTDAATAEQVLDLLNAAKYGMQPLAASLDAMLDRESNPSYEPVSKRYVLGLVRLPDGVWAYRLPRREPVRSAGYGYSY